jgi:hypothetical protein
MIYILYDSQHQTNNNNSDHTKNNKNEQLLLDLISSEKHKLHINKIKKVVKKPPKNPEKAVEI